MSSFNFLKRKIKKIITRIFSIDADDKAYKKICIETDIPGFSDLARKTIAGKRTLLDTKRLHVLWQCVGLAPKGTNMLEIGVYKGGSADFLVEAAKLQGKGTRFDFYAVDTFTGHTSVVKELDGDHEVNKGFSDVDYEEVKSYLGKHENVTMIKGDIVTVSDEIKHDKDLGFVHIDVDVYLATLFSLEYSSKRLADGGIIVCDDYGYKTCHGAMVAVDEFLERHDDFRKFYFQSGQCAIFRPCNRVAFEERCDENDYVPCRHLNLVVENGNSTCSIPDDEGLPVFCDGGPEDPCYEPPGKDPKE